MSSEAYNFDTPIVHCPISNSEHQLRAVTDQIFLGFLNDTARKLREADDPAVVRQALDELFGGLRERKLNASDAEWQSFVALCRQHPLRELVHQDPFTHRAYSKPRGYAGDAEMMDFIYSREESWPPPPAGRLGREVFDYTTQAPASEGVRARRAFIAARIDRLAESRRSPHLLSVAAGHLREAGMSVAVRRRRTGRFVALDADPQSAAEVERCYRHLGVETVTASFRRLLVDYGVQGDFDLVYSTGLFDYLAQRTARRLATAMFQRVRPGGSMLIANFLPGIRDIGYMEAFMDWKLVFRNRQEMVDLTSDIPEDSIREVSVCSEECRNIVFLEVHKV